MSRNALYIIIYIRTYSPALLDQPCTSVPMLPSIKRFFTSNAILQRNTSSQLELASTYASQIPQTLGSTIYIAAILLV